MPIPSKAANRFWHWAAAHPKEAGVKPSVAQEFVASAHGKSLKNLPEHVEHKAAGGAVAPGSYQRPTMW